MNIHEYEGKALLAAEGVPVPEGYPAAAAAEAEAVAAKLGRRCVVKAQVHVGGRGKAGGVKLANNPAEARAAAEAILALTIKGLPVRQLLVEEALDIAGEYYLALTLDRATRRTVIIASASGGVDIEEVAASTPEKVVREPIDPAFGLQPFQITRVMLALGLPSAQQRAAGTILAALDRAYRAHDCTLAEINPLVVTGDGQVIAADAKFNFDDSARFRHAEWDQYATDAQTDPIEAEAQRRGLQYVRLQATDLGGAAPAVAVIGNGAGLVMGTLDEVSRVGRDRGVGPANFLDLGGGARAEVVRQALEVVLLNPDVRGVFLNIFGGITRCDEVARGLLAAADEVELKVPLVVRLTGTNEEEGRALLAADGRFQPFTEFAPAAEAIVAAVAG